MISKFADFFSFAVLVLVIEWLFLCGLVLIVYYIGVGLAIKIKIDDLRENSVNETSPPSVVFPSQRNEESTIREKNGLIMRDYSDRSVLLTGTTLKYKTQIKDVGGGSWNRSLRGWVFSKKRLEYLNKMFDELS